jgi:hypothetical protein
MIMPDIQIKSESWPNAWYGMTIQHSMPGSAGWWGGIALILWCVLLVTGLQGLIFVRQQPKLRAILGLTIVAQLALSILYGRETFLYSMHFAPLLVVLAAFSTFTRARVFALVMAGMLIIGGGISNGLQFMKAVGFVRVVGTLSHEPLTIDPAMATKRLTKALLP